MAHPGNPRKSPYFKASCPSTAAPTAIDHEVQNRGPWASEVRHSHWHDHSITGARLVPCTQEDRSSAKRSTNWTWLSRKAGPGGWHSGELTPAGSSDSSAGSLTFDVQGLHHTMVDQLKVLVADPVLHVSLPAREEVVHHSHLVAVHHESVSEMGAHEPRSSSYLQQGSVWNTPGESTREHADSQPPEDMFLGQPQPRTYLAQGEGGRWQGLQSGILTAYSRARGYTISQLLNSPKLKLPPSEEDRKLVVTCFKMSPSRTENFTLIKGSCWSIIHDSPDTELSAGMAGRTKKTWAVYTQWNTLSPREVPTGDTQTHPSEPGRERQMLLSLLYRI